MNYETFATPDETTHVRFHHDAFSHECEYYLSRHSAIILDEAGEDCQEEEWLECAVCGEEF